MANCSIISNRLGTSYASGTAWGGGGVWALSATLRNCLILGNGNGNVDRGSGVGSGSSVTLDNCTILKNYGIGIGSFRGHNGGATFRVNNTISYYNLGADMDPGSNTTSLVGGALVASNCCLMSIGYVTSGSGNIAAAPAFMQQAGGDYRLASWSRGVDAGLTLPWMSTATDLAGNPRISANNLPDMGAYETTAGGPAATYYVAQNGQTPVSPYTNGWTVAASNIQDAVDVMSDGTTILVKNGTYTLPAPVTVNFVTIRSDNNGVVDRAGTIVNGNYPNVTNRCFTLNHAEAVVEGLTVTNGYLTGANYGGGVQLIHGTLRNCLVTGNTITNNVDASVGGGGVYAINADSLITNCDIVANTAKGTMQGGGAYLDTSAQLWNSRVLYNRGGNSPSSGAGGGGVRVSSSALLCNSVIASNVSSYQGGGVALYGTNSIMRNCLVKGNSSTYSADNAGVVAIGLVNPFPKVESCTIVNNPIKVPYSGGSAAVFATFVNVVHDSAIVFGYSASNAVLTNCCFTTTNGFVNSSGNIATNNPGFANAAAGNYRLTKSSPCVGAGLYQAWMTGAVDLDGNPRISPTIDGTVDIGAYEFPIQFGTTFVIH